MTPQEVKKLRSHLSKFAHTHERAIYAALQGRNNHADRWDTEFKAIIAAIAKHLDEEHAA